jgi:hypothetical protein
LQIRRVAERLAAGNGGYEIVHSTPGLELGVYVLVAPEPDRQQPQEWDELYVVLEGRGTLDVEGEHIPVEEGAAIRPPGVHEVVLSSHLQSAPVRWKGAWKAA